MSNHFLGLLLPPLLQPLQHGVVKILKPLLLTGVLRGLHVGQVLIEHLLARDGVLVDDGGRLAFAFPLLL
jgi:hypothetical protein